MINPNIQLAMPMQDSGDYALVDPVTNEMVRGIPEALLEYPEFVQGISFLQDHAEAIHADVYLARHADHTDLGKQHEFENAITAHEYGAVFLESQFWKTEDQALLQKYAARKVSLATFADRFTNTQALRTVMAIGSDTNVYYADVPNETESEAGTFFRQARTLAGVSSKAKMSELSEEEMMKEANFASYQNLREWYAVGAIGYNLESQYHDLPIDVFVSYGAAHEGLVEKLRSLAIQTNRADSNEHAAHHPASVRIMGAIATGVYKNS